MTAPWNPWCDPPFSDLEEGVVELPVGAVVPFAGRLTEALALDGWRYCDGSALLKLEYLRLYEVLGDAYGTPDEGEGYFLLPDYRGWFLRGVDDGSCRDPDAAARIGSGPGWTGASGDEVGSAQWHQLQDHEHDYVGGTVASEVVEEGTVAVLANENETTTGLVCGGDPPACYDPPPGVSCGGVETRPINLAVYFLIKARRSIRTMVVPSPRPPGPPRR